MKSIADVHGKLRRLSKEERRLLIQSWLLLILVDLALRLLPFTAIMAYGRRRSARQEHFPMDASLPASRLGRLVETAGRYCPTGTSCLKEALVLSRLLARRGVPTTLRIGVGRHQGEFSAHAWLEQDGRVILGESSRGAHVPLLPVRQ